MIFIIILSVIFIALGTLLLKPRKQSLVKKHVLVTGGSSGIGKAVAVEAARMGADITLVARDVKKLECAQAEVLKNCLYPDKQKVQYVSLDVTSSYETVEKALLASEDKLGPIFLLVNCAGVAVCGRLEDTTAQNIKDLIDLNILGTIYPIKAVVSHMKCRGEGIIVFVGSQASFLGIYGFSTYCGTKFALRGLAEALSMECKPYNVSVTLALPPDTDTPGFAAEQKTKPLETRLISESSGIVPPRVVAKQLIKDALNGTFYSTVGFEGFLLRTLCAGMTPVSSVFELLIQVTFMGFCRLICYFYLMSFHRIVRTCMKTRDKTKKSE